MKRPPGLWLLLTIVALWLKVQDVYSVRATALIFGKTTTTTTTLAPPSDTSNESNDAGITEASSPETETQNSTKPQLTGIPQIDYIYDPNLPRELNGYNLSEYPFYDRVPEDLNFKCDGLHDGFYASVPHKCQVYHHCLFGVRYDFLCANYTAFDQKTFICHFVSEVDCLNSKKFWHRNDALYKATTTTTVKPPPIYTLPPAPATSVPIVPILQRRPERPRRPLARRRPYEYYDEEYDDDYYEKPARRQRPRYRPRVYDDEYDYEEEDYVRRPNGRRNENRKPFKSRNSNRRRPYDDEEYEDEMDDTRRPDSGRRNSDDARRPLKRRPSEDDEYDRRTYDRPRKKGYRRPIDEEYEDDPPPRRASDRRKNKNRDERDEVVDEERPRSKSNRDDRPRQNSDRNRNNDSVDDNSPRNRNDRDRTKNEESLGDDRTSRNSDKIKPDEYDEKPLQKPPVSIYDRQRPALKVRPPVPAHQQSKYSPKVTKTTTPEPVEEEYYDDLQEDIKKQEEPRKSTAKENTRKIITTTQSSFKRGYGNVKKSEDYEDDLEPVTRRSNKRPKYGDDNFGNKDRRVFSNSRRRPVIEEYDDYEEKSKIIPEKSTTTTTTTTTTKEPPREPVVKVVKRPFLLPSRGGSPYPRGLLPVGAKAADTSSNDELQDTKFRDETGEVNTDNKLVKVIKIPVSRNNKNNYDEEFTPISNRPITRIVKIATTTTTTTEKPKAIERNPLDLDENEYDVTLNDALNPTLPNLPIRNFPTGFSAQNDYTYNTVQRPRYVIDPIINQASSDYVYRIEQPEANNIRYKAVPVFQSFRQSPRVTQAIYSPY